MKGNKRSPEAEAILWFSVLCSKEPVQMLSCVCSVSNVKNLLMVPKLHGTNEGQSSAGLWRTIHLVALGHRVRTVKAIQEDRGYVCNQIPVNGCLGRAIDGTHSCGLSFGILHDLCD